MGARLNDPSAISGVHIHPLKQICDERGAVLHMLRSNDPHFSTFGEIYFSVVNAGVAKGWKRHKRMTQRFCVPAGRVKVVIYDSREESLTRGAIGEYLLGRPDNYFLLQIPPMVWYGFQGVAAEGGMIANCPDMPHDPDESERCELTNPAVPYRWEEPGKEM